MPGGSWSNELYWNGNKVRLSEENYIEKQVWDSTIKAGGNPVVVGFDTARFRNGSWDVDYSGYAPGFRIGDTAHHLSDFHGFTDVLFLHKYIQSYGAETMVTVNMGTGSPQMAAEWVKWTRERKNYARRPFDVRYWELGNELDGDWELGHFLPDGSKMNSKEYIRRYKLFTKAMKAAGPDIKVGGSVASSMELVFIEDLIKDTACMIDFISFHAYPSNNDDTDFVSMVQRAEQVNDAVARIKSWIHTYRPGQANKIEIAVTEWNIKVREDITTVDIRNALWSAVMIGEMAKAGVDIAIQWDMFSTTPTGGHGLFNPDDPAMQPRSQYWAMYLWSRYMGHNLLKTDLEAPDGVRTYVSMENGTTAIMLINGSSGEAAEIKLNMELLRKKQWGMKISFSKEQYRLNKETLIPELSTKPLETKIKLKKGQSLKLPPQSITIIRFKSKI
jgi:alpha-L-arabinofuranosidase